MARTFLTVVGIAYILLAGWCSFLPEQTSKSIGFNLQSGSGQSEYLTVYGGLQFGLGLIFLWPLLRPSEIAFPLFLCLLIHGCLVAFRTASFMAYSGIPAMTYFFAALEWIIFLGAVSLYWGRR